MAWLTYTQRSAEELAKLAQQSLDKTSPTRSKDKARDLAHLVRALRDFTHTVALDQGSPLREQAAEELVARCRRAARYHANRSEREAEDAEQAAMIRMLGKAGGYVPDIDRRRASFSTYINMTLKRGAEARSKADLAPGKIRVAGSTESTLSVDYTGSDGDAGADAFHPRTESADAALQMTVADALALLPPEQREAIVATTMEGRSAPEVAAELGLSVDQVRSRVRAAKKSLAETLAGVVQG